MIKNERQYRITKAQAAKLDAALKSFLEQSANDRTTHPRLLKAQAEAMQSQIESLYSELREYEEVKAGNEPLPDLRPIAGLPQALIRARIASGLNQKELAERLEMPEQQIQRYESTEYESVSFARIAEIANILQNVLQTLKPAPDKHAGSRKK